MDSQKDMQNFSSYIMREYGESVLFNNHKPVDLRHAELFKAWQAAKANAVPEWISVEDKLPETEPNTDGVVCAVVCSLGNVYRARYMHDVDIGVDTKYWSEFAVNYNGREYEHYEINAKISHWIPLPDAPQEPAND